MLQTTTTPRKELKPFPSSKGRIFRIYNTLSDSYIRESIHDAQQLANPHSCQERNKKRHCLSPNEIKELVKILGVPDGYENPLE